MADDYVFGAHEADPELARLRMIEELTDATTIRLLRRSGIGAGWKCLELGAGAGSILSWMGAAVGAEGSVLGVDRDGRHLRVPAGGPVRVLEADFLEVPLEGAFDLAHCRYVLIHNRTRDRILRKLCGALAPGGFLVVEEPDFTSARLLGGSTGAAVRRVDDAICRMFEDIGSDPGYGLRLPEKVAAEGLRIVDVDSRLHLAPGGSIVARVMGASAQALADRYVATGEARGSDVDEYVESAKDDRSWKVYYSTVSVVASKPPSPAGA